ncbi:hypothetical protein GCM10009122_00060 [Fulvivirga kasyanovii]|uniref:Amino acid adenylation domain-containing protein n=1 Tax=Fulvivirga kasyanovii TaxID=396812 RepID=A0ABW9RQ76_9BACT|nr:non-ribosomal peptide synthetase [Fulvivirga kasyanovii]MTI26091.1 amino acid adenylation domain-containing protein [Fulvivirga kasyanovii]
MKPTLTNKNDLVILANQKTEQRKYWENKLSGRNDITHFVFDNIDLNDDPEYVQYEAEFSNVTYEMINKVSAKADIKLFTVLLSAVSYITSKYTDAELVSIGTPVFNENTITQFLVLTNIIESGMTFRQLLNNSKSELRQVNENSDYPLSLLIEKLGFRTSNSPRAKLFDISLTLDNIQDYELVQQHQANINLRFLKKEDSLNLIVDYNQNVYSKTSIDDIVKKVERFLMNAMVDLDANLNQLSLIDEDEKTEIANITTGQNIPVDSTLIQLFEQAVANYPDVVAVSDEKQTLTYSQLSQRSNDVAKYLIDHVGRVNEICVLHHRNVNLLIYVLGILKASKTFVPLNPDDPADRLKYILKNCGAGLLITDPEYLSSKTSFINHCKAKNIGIISNPVIDSGKVTTFDNLSLPNAPAYIVYTSGTTGKPKGVEVTHGNLSNYLYWASTRYLGNKSDSMALHSNIAFDMSMTSMFTPLINGNEVICFQEHPDQFIIEKVIYDNRTTVLKLTPSHLKLILYKFDKTEKKFSTLLSNLKLKKIIVGGEALEAQTARSIYDLFDGKVEIFNEYGPTEATVGCLVHRYDLNEDKTESISIGKPINNIRVFVLGEEKELLPKGFVGELYITGLSLANGYVKNKPLTEDRFITLPDICDTIMYRTGDMVSLLPNGALIYLGRKDEQVKVRGYRVELGEIRKQIASHEEVDSAEVIVKEDQEGSNYLICYYTSLNDLKPADLKVYSTEKLPAYMVPLHFIRLDQMPLSASGKLNKKALPPIKEDDLQILRTPRNKLEEELLVLWKETLESSQIGIESNFYQIGGDSIRAIRLIAKLNKAYKIKLVIADLFSNPTIAELSSVIEAKEKNTENELLDKVRKEIKDLKAEIIKERKDSAEIEDVYPISDIQLGMIFHSRLEEGGALYHDQMVEHMAYSHFNFERFKKALDLMVKKHSILRTSFDLRSHSKPVQIVFKNVDLDLELYHLSHLSTEQQTDHIRRFSEDDRLKPFDIMKSPLWRIRVFVLNNSEIIVLWVVHHALIDGWSDASFKTELHNTYELLGLDDNHQLSSLKADYKDYVIEELANSNNDALKSFWAKEISCSKPIRFGGQNKVKEKLSIGYSSLKLSNEMEGMLEECALTLGVDIKTLFFSAYLLTIKTLTRQDDLIVGLVAHNRPEIEDGDKILGCFLNTLPIRINLEDSWNYGDLVQSVYAKLKLIQEYKQLTLQEIKSQRWKKSTQDTFLFDTIFNYMDFHIYDSAMQMETLNNEELDIPDWSVTNYTLSLNVGKVRGGFEIELVYHHGVVSDLAMEFCGIMKRSLEYIIRQPSEAIASGSLFQDLDKLFENVYWNKKSYDDVEVWELLKNSNQSETELKESILDIDNIKPLSEKSMQILSRPMCLTHQIKGNIDPGRMKGAYMQLVNELNLTNNLLKGNNELNSNKDFLIEFTISKCDRDKMDQRIFDFYQAVRTSNDIQISVVLFILPDDKHLLLQIIPAYLYESVLWEEMQNQLWRFYEGKTNKVKFGEGYEFLNSVTKQLEFWTSEFSENHEYFNLPTDFKSKQNKTEEFETCDFSISSEVLASLRQTGTDNQIPISSILLSAIGILLAKLQSNRIVTIEASLSHDHGSPLVISENNSRSTIPINVVLEDTSFLNIISENHRKVIESKGNQGYLIDYLAEASDSINTGLQSSVVFEYIKDTSLVYDSEEIEVKPYGLAGLAQRSYALSFRLIEYKDSLGFSIQYDSALFKPDTIQRYSGYFNNILSSVSNDPKMKLSQIDILPHYEKSRILNEFNSTDINYSISETVISLFESRATIFADKVALWYGSESMTYAEFDELTTKISSYLIKQYNVQSGQLVGVMMEREKYLVPCIFAILKTGAAYVPIDPNFPEDRKRFIMEDAGLQVLLTRSEYWSIFDDSLPEVLDMNTAINNILETENVIDFPTISNNDLAYVMYTSGSTGRPKGVIIEHHSLSNIIQWLQREYVLDSNDVLLLKTPIVFDVSAWELFWWPLAGASLSILEPEFEKDPERMIGIIDAHQVTVINFVPSMLNIFLSSLSDRMAVDKIKSLRYVIASGEALKPEHKESFKDQVHNAVNTQLINIYGPTETNGVTFHNCDFNIDNTAIPIGRPIDNSQLFILDEYMRPVPIGVYGQLYIAGTCLGRGYLNKPELTHSKFVNHPFREHDKCYQTGDVARFLESGEIEFLGRMDSQVKVRGFRIELSEIEHCLAKHESVQEAAVVCIEKNSEMFLVAYYVSDNVLDPLDLKAMLSHSLPYYMIPSYYQHLESIPLTSNGKRNTKYLSDLNIELEHKYSPPTDQVEKDLVEIWSTVLNIEKDQVGINTDVFDMGGSSLTLMLLVDKIHWSFGYKLSIGELYNKNKISEIATMIRANLVVADNFDDEDIDKIVI